MWCAQHSSTDAARAPGLPRALRGPDHVSDLRGWRGVGLGTEGSGAGSSKCSGQRVRKPDGWATQGQFIPDNYRTGGKGERVPQVATVSRALCPSTSGAGIQAIRRAVDGLASGNKRPACAPSGNGFRTLPILQMNYCGRASVYTVELFLRPREAVTGRGG